MDNVKRIAALYLVLTALAVFFNLILTPVYHDGSPEYPVWKIVNYFMAAGTILALAASFIRRRAAGNPDSETGEAVTSHLIYFPLVDALFVIVALDAARWLWRRG